MMMTMTMTTITSFLHAEDELYLTALLLRTHLHAQDSYLESHSEQSFMLLGPTRTRKVVEGLTLRDLGYSSPKTAQP